MKRYVVLVWHLIVVTIALYLVRPCEALYKAIKYSLTMFGRCFVDEFKDVYSKQGWDSLALYKTAVNRFKEKK